MIEARHQRWADLIFKMYIYRLMRKNFSRISLFGDIPELNREWPTLLVPNHTTWWDGFFIYLLNKEVFLRKTYLMMLEDQLRRFSFFRRIGVYGIDPDNAKKSLKTLRYTVSLLAEQTSPRSLVCLFPQGELMPWTSEGLNFKGGVDWIVEKYQQPLNLVLLGMRCEFTDKQHAEVFLMCSENYRIDGKSFKGRNWLEETESNLLKSLQQKIINREQGRTLLKGKSKR